MLCSSAPAAAPAQQQKDAADGFGLLHAHLKSIVLVPSYAASCYCYHSFEDALVVLLVLGCCDEKTMPMPAADVVDVLLLVLVLLLLDLVPPTSRGMLAYSLAANDVVPLLQPAAGINVPGDAVAKRPLLVTVRPQLHPAGGAAHLHLQSIMKIYQIEVFKSSSSLFSFIIYFASCMNTNSLSYVIHLCTVLVVRVTCLQEDQG